ncbi:MAG: xanthine dehydrogenase accessory factor [Myxococcota bacterium]|jgi:xanthine dehydrogenase accessory factor
MNVFAAAAEAWRTGRPAALATVIGVGGSTPRSAGSRMLVYADGSTVGTIGGGALEHRAILQAIDAVGDRRPRRYTTDLRGDLGMCCGGRVEVWIEPLDVREEFVVFGAGHVAAATVPLLHSLDFAVTVVDDRPEWNSADRFDGCTLHDGDPRSFAQTLATHERTWILVVTHDHGLDQDIVHALLHRPFAWLGMIGSQAKVARFLDRFLAAGLSPDALRRLCAPVGLDIGAETPAEIAIAICAELVRVRRGSRGAPLPLSDRVLPQRGGAASAPRSTAVVRPGTAPGSAPSGD